MKKTVTTSLAALAVAGMIGGGTFASWSDFQEWNGNQSGAGTLTLGTTAPASQAFSIGNLTPGQVKETEVWLVSNESTSTPDGTMWITLDNLVGVEDGCQGNSEVLIDLDCAGSNQGEFPETAQVRVTTKQSDETTCGVAHVGGPPSGYEKLIFGGGIVPDIKPSETLRAMETAGKLQILKPGAASSTYDPAIFQPGEGVCVAFHVYVPTDADNGVQGDQASFDLRFDLEQDV